jgi:3-isopropylmalate dehydratase small subunit
MKEITGKLFKLGDDVDTAQILPEQYHTATDATELAKHVLEGYDSGFPAKIKRGRALVAGSHFGCGPAPTQAALALKAAGVSCIVAKSFGRAFFRHAINHGLLLVAADIVDKVNDGDDIAINLEQGIITHPTGEASFAPYPEFVCRIIQTGDLIAAVKKELGKK